MPIAINGTGTITGISAGGLPDGCITPAELSGAQTGSAPIYGVRAWVNFDGTRNEADSGASTDGANVKIRGSGNVTSVLKNGAGDYTISFTTAMANINYAVFGSCENTTAFNVLKTFQNAAGTIVAPTTSAVRIVTGNSTTNQDPTYVSVGIIQ